ncbi:MAG: response regulator [Ignavibacteriales bacterium]|nr:response regulator [Ignavibacteriales bacterium]
MNQTSNILVVDDEKVIIDGIIKICSLEDYSIDFAMNTSAAIEKLSKNYYSIIVCDIMMPDGDGFQVLDALKSKNIDTALIMMTGYSTVENAVNSLTRGAIDFIPKPFTVDELLSSLYRANKYQQIKKKQNSHSNGKSDIELFYVECPARYYRLGYSSWLFEEKDGSVLVGACDFFLATIDSVAEIEFLNAEEQVMQGISYLTIKTTDGRMHKIHSPVSGTIIEVNENLKSNPALIEKNPYFDGWIYRIIPRDLGYEIENLIPCSSDRLQSNN